MAEEHGTTAPRQPAVLLLGPTGSGKSPLGEALERHGLRTRRCAHFDFGAHLRRAASDVECARDCGLNTAEQAIAADVLTRGTLLEDTGFNVALKLLDAFAAARALDDATDLILNGLPRHVGQARMLSNRLRVSEVILLECSAAVVLQRIQMNTGGDRSGRRDDDPTAVRRRIKLFQERTAPLEAYYAAGGARVTRLAVGANTMASALIRTLHSEEKSVDAD